MKLFVFRNGSKEKIYLAISAESRRELRRKIRSKRFMVEGRMYSVNEVFAESSSDTTTGGAIAGGLIGILGGIPGIVIGALAGGLIGNSEDEEEKKKVEQFNLSPHEY